MLPLPHRSRVVIAGAGADTKVEEDIKTEKSPNIDNETNQLEIPERDEVTVASARDENLFPSFLILELCFLHLHSLHGTR